MSSHRFFLTSAHPSDPGQPLPLSADDVHHAASVLRLRDGETVDVVTPDERVWRGSVARATKRGLWASDFAEVAAGRVPHVTLFQGVAKGEKMDAIVRQAVEIGAEEIVPVLTARSVVQLDARKAAQRAERWRRVATAAAKQAKRTSVPAVADPVRLRDALPLLAAYDGAVVLWEESGGAGVSDAVRRCGLGGDARIALFVGPEGGLASEEVSALEAIGATTASLGPTILRTETAAIVALALAIGALGGLGESRD